jgi:hypothetical protein
MTATGPSRVYSCGGLMDKDEFSLIADRLPCAAAFRVGAHRGVAPRVIVEELARSGVRVGFCQLGLFGYESFGEKRLTGICRCVPPEVQTALHSATETGALSCQEAWCLADRLGIPRLLVGAAATLAEVRITDCPLGCFS